MIYLGVKIQNALADSVKGLARPKEGLSISEVVRQLLLIGLATSEGQLVWTPAGPVVRGFGEALEDSAGWVPDE